MLHVLAKKCHRTQPVEMKNYPQQKHCIKKGKGEVQRSKRELRNQHLVLWRNCGELVKTYL
jgi:hypothetical protein